MARDLLGLEAPLFSESKWEIQMSESVSVVGFVSTNHLSSLFFGMIMPLDDHVFLFQQILKMKCISSQLHIHDHTV